jgi:hypothetical protein
MKSFSLRLAISQNRTFGDTSDDILSLANVSIGKINQTNPGVVRGRGSVPTPIPPNLLVSKVQSNQHPLDHLLIMPRGKG